MIFTKDKIEIHKVHALASLEALIDSYISENPSKANKFLFWLEDYAKFLNYEPDFNPQRLRRYKRGEVIKVHLGYNIGSEEGGLHYCVVIENDNAVKSPTITVIPLTSIKDGKDYSKLKKGDVFLGQDLRNKLEEKLENLSKTIKQLLSEIQIDDEELTEEQREVNVLQIQTLLSKLELVRKTSDELKKMKKGSIALVGQITTISKIRIYDPKTNYDVLAKIKLSDENLDKIDDELSKLYQKNSKKSIKILTNA